MATGTKADILDAVGQLCRTDSPEFVAAGLTVFLANAVRQYSRDKPYEDVEDVTGSAAKLQATPASWVEEWSQIRKIVYPYVDEDSTTLEQDDYEIDTVPSGGVPVEKIRFRSAEPAATETVRVWFSRPHDCTDSTCTVPANDVSALAHLVAAKVETAKASYFLGLKDQAQTADLIDYGAKSGQAKALAKMHLDAYRDALGLPDSDKTIPAGVAGDVDTDPQYTPYVSHQRHHRARQR